MGGTIVAVILFFAIMLSPSTSDGAPADQPLDTALPNALFLPLVYNPASPTPTPTTTLIWASKTSMQTRREGLGVAGASNGKVYAVGGYFADTSNHYLTTLEQYDPATNFWSTMASMPTGRVGLGFAAATNGKLYAAGGFFYDGTNH